MRRSISGSGCGARVRSPSPSCIREGEELKVDYSTFTISPGWRMECSYRQPACRRVVTGEHGRQSEIQDRYARHFIPTIVATVSHKR